MKTGVVGGQNIFESRLPVMALCSRCGKEFRKIANTQACKECREAKRLAKRQRIPQVIEPFSGDIDRNAFGHWLSGFTDGEGSFHLGINQSVCDPGWGVSVFFTISLRDDDVEILKSVQSYWMCGWVRPHKKKTNKSKPSMVYRVHGVDNLMSIVVPHFDCFPLRAKKQRDFTTWRQGVELAYVVKNRLHFDCVREGCHNTKWTDEEKELFSTLVVMLKEGRKYVQRVEGGDL